MDGETVREFATDAIRYWERRRILYNILLAAIVLIYFFVSGTKVHRDFLNLGLVLVLLAVLANVAYCAAYVVDIFAQMSGFREQWREFRWVLFTIGVVFASILTHFWAMALLGPE